MIAFVKAKSYDCITVINAKSESSSSVTELVSPGLPVPSPLIASSDGLPAPPPASLPKTASAVESLSIGGVFPVFKSSSALEISATFVIDVPWNELSTVSVMKKSIVPPAASTVAPVFAVATAPFKVQALFAGLVASKLNPVGMKSVTSTLYASRDP